MIAAETNLGINSVFPVPKGVSNITSSLINNTVPSFISQVKATFILISRNFVKLRKTVNRKSF